MFATEYDLSSLRDIETNNYKLKHKQWIMNNKTYDIFKYDKNILTSDMVNSIGLYRSIICHNNKILAFSPPKSLNINIFMNLHSENECLAEEFVEGTMINLFYDDSIDKWEIASKSTVGGNITFCKDNPTFSE